MRKKLPWFEIVLSIVFLGAYVYAAFSDAYNLPNRWFIRDDAYYYFKVAQNISEGHGSTFDGIHLTNGYHPLWMVICVPIFALARYDLILPLRVLVLVTGVLQAATAILLYRLLKSVISTAMAMVAAAYWVFDTFILVFLYKTGVESCIALFFIVLLLLLVSRFERTWRQNNPSVRELATLGIVSSLVVFSRLDLIFFALIMGVWIVLRQSPLRYLLPLDVLAIFVATLTAFLARLGFAVYYEAAPTALTAAIVSMVVMVPSMYLFGLYERPSSWRPLQFLGRLLAALLLGSGLTSASLLAANYFHILPTLSRVVLLYDAGLTLGLIFLIRLAAWLFHTGRTAPEPALRPIEELQAYWRTWLRDGTIYFGIVGGTLSLYMLWNRLVFGSFSPVSGEVKRWWGTFLISVYGGPAKTWLSFFGVDPYGEFNAWQPFTNGLRDWSNTLLYKEGSKFGNPQWQQNFTVVLAVSLALVLLILFLTRRKATRVVVQASLIPLFVGSLFQALSYNSTGYASPKEWYWLTEQVLLVILAALLLHVLFETWLQRATITRVLLWVLVGGFAVWTGGGYWRDAIALNPYGQAAPGSPYAEVVPFLETHTQPGAIIGMTGGGNVGYFLHDRTIVNMDGLINSPEYFRDLQAGTSPEYLFASGMRYVFANPSLLDANPYRGQYKGRLEGIASWGGKDLMKLLPDPSE